MSNKYLAEFNKSVDDFAKTIPQQVNELQRKIVLEALKRIIEKTPVDTGRARGNWQVTIGTPATGVVKNRKWRKKKGAERKTTVPALTADDQDIIKKAAGVLSEKMAAFDVVWISNNLEYIEYLEEGSSQQAPDGMVVLTLMELEEMFRNAA